MSLRERIEGDLKTALKAGDKTRLGCLRMIKARMQEREVALRGEHGKDYELTDEEAEQVIATYGKQRRDSIDSYDKGGRDDLAEQERAELAIVTGYLPQQMTRDQIATIVAAAVAESGATSARDLGAVMKLVMPQVKGKADGKLVNEVVREKLGA